MRKLGARLGSSKASTKLLYLLALLNLVSIGFQFNIPTGIETLGLRFISPYKLLLPLLSVILFLHVFREPQDLWRTGLLGRVASAFVLVQLVSAVASGMQLELNLRRWVWLVAGLMYYLGLVLSITSEKRLQAFLQAYALVGLTVAALGFLEKYGTPQFDWFFALFRPNVINPDAEVTVPPALHTYIGAVLRVNSTLNYGPIVLTLTALTAMSSYFVSVRQMGEASRKPWRNAVLWLIITMIQVQVMLWNYSRSVIIALFMGSGVLTALHMIAGKYSNPQGFRHHVWWTALPLVVLCVLLSANLFVDLTLKLRVLPGLGNEPILGHIDRSNRRLKLDQLSDQEWRAISKTHAQEVRKATNSSNHNRIALARVAIQMLKDHPVLGVGYANFSVQLRTPRYAQVFPYVVRGEEPTMMDAHNLFLQTLATSGAIGLVALLAILGSVCALLCKSENTGDFELGVWVPGLAGTWVALVTQSMFGYSLFDPPLMLSFMSLLGFTQAYVNLRA
ncbi:MAG: O-antigen ligase family protein [Bacillota bacterium]|nr:O-antigen ligase family protein [Bacillota bacterium]